MKLTVEQLQLLQDTIRERVTYRETYEEVYDHIITALEHTENNIPLGEAINTIILNDFGGFAGLRLIERKRRWMIWRQSITQQLNNISSHFKFRLLPVTLGIFCLSYYCISRLNFKPDVLYIILTAVFIGLGLKYLRYFKRRIILKDAKKSIKDYPLYIISLIPFYVLWFGSGLNVILFKGNFFPSFTLNPILLSLLFTIYVIYNISFFKMYLEEYRKLNAK